MESLKARIKELEALAGSEEEARSELIATKKQLKSIETEHFELKVDFDEFYKKENLLLQYRSEGNNINGENKLLDLLNSIDNQNKQKQKIFENRLQELSQIVRENNFKETQELKVFDYERVFRSDEDKFAYYIPEDENYLSLYCTLKKEREPSELIKLQTIITNKTVNTEIKLLFEEKNNKILKKKIHDTIRSNIRLKKEIEKIKDSQKAIEDNRAQITLAESLAVNRLVGLSYFTRDEGSRSKAVAIEMKGIIKSKRRILKELKDERNQLQSNAAVISVSLKLTRVQFKKIKERVADLQTDEILLQELNTKLSHGLERYTYFFQLIKSVNPEAYYFNPNQIERSQIITKKLEGVESRRFSLMKEQTVSKIIINPSFSNSSLQVDPITTPKSETKAEKDKLFTNILCFYNNSIEELISDVVSKYQELRSKSIKKVIFADYTEKECLEKKKHFDACSSELDLLIESFCKLQKFEKLDYYIKYKEMPLQQLEDIFCIIKGDTISKCKKLLDLNIVQIEYLSSLSNLFLRLYISILYLQKHIPEEYVDVMLKKNLHKEASNMFNNPGIEIKNKYDVDLMQRSFIPLSEESLISYNENEWSKLNIPFSKFIDDLKLGTSGLEGKDAYMIGISSHNIRQPRRKKNTAIQNFDMQLARLRNLILGAIQSPLREDQINNADLLSWTIKSLPFSDKFLSSERQYSFLDSFLSSQSMKSKRPHFNEIIFDFGNAIHDNFVGSIAFCSNRYQTAYINILNARERIGKTNNVIFEVIDKENLSNILSDRKDTLKGFPTESIKSPLLIQINNTVDDKNTSLQEDELEDQLSVKVGNSLIDDLIIKKRLLYNDFRKKAGFLNPIKKRGSIRSRSLSETTAGVNKTSNEKEKSFFDMNIFIKGNKERMNFEHDFRASEMQDSSHSTKIQDPNEYVRNVDLMIKNLKHLDSLCKKHKPNYSRQYDNTNFLIKYKKKKAPHINSISKLSNGYSQLFDKVDSVNSFNQQNMTKIQKNTGSTSSRVEESSIGLPHLKMNSSCNSSGLQNEESTKISKKRLRRKAPDYGSLSMNTSLINSKSKSKRRRKIKLESIADAADGGRSLLKLEFSKLYNDN